MMSTKWALHDSPRILLILLGAVAPVLIMGCSSTENAPSESPVDVAARQAQESGNDYQYQILQDGEVSEAEFEDALGRQISCLNTGGISTTAPEKSLADSHFYRYELTPSPGLAANLVQSVQDDCYAESMSLVERAYKQTNPSYMDPALLDGVAECLEERGVELNGDERGIPDFQGDPGNATGDDINFCIPEVGADLYPGVVIPFTYEEPIP